MAETTEEMGKAAELLQKVARPLINLIVAVIPIVINCTTTCYKFYKKLPIVCVHLIIGFIMCFFGGLYPTVFAAIQAAEHGGLATMKKALIDLSEEVMVIIEENKKDNEVDADGDGKSDVDQISSQEFVRRKVSLVLRKMNPQRVNDAIASLYKTWLSVLAVLTIEFARTIALALTIADFVRKFMNRWVAPTIEKATPVEYKKWVPILVDWICKGIGVSLAWRIQTVISAATSAMAGGLIISRAILLLVAKGKDHNDTRADEAASYIFAGAGFYFQYYVGFKAPFPLNLVLWPLDIAESYIRWSITKRT
ncbi:hypothetical protein HJC23_003210 [Cyclotella cryptica]|uniref:Uncharacterized protein n=1 Tax=Cyclotella cryptica TaxID=29204 RepID=A0ABD3PEC4_9STRA